MKLINISQEDIANSLTYYKTGKSTSVDRIIDQIFEHASFIKLARIKYLESSYRMNYSLTEFTMRMKNIFHENLSTYMNYTLQILQIFQMSDSFKFNINLY